MSQERQHAYSASEDTRPLEEIRSEFLSRPVRKFSPTRLRFVPHVELHKMTLGDTSQCLSFSIILEAHYIYNASILRADEMSLRELAKESAVGLVRAALNGHERELGRPDSVSVSSMRFGRVLSEELRGLMRVRWRRRNAKVQVPTAMEGGRAVLSDKYEIVDDVYKKVISSQESTLVACDNYSCSGAAVVVPRSSLQTCSRCKAVFYCSRECQRSHWTAEHRRQCSDAGSDFIFTNK